MSVTEALPVAGPTVSVDAFSAEQAGIAQAEQNAPLGYRELLLPSKLDPSLVVVADNTKDYDKTGFEGEGYGRLRLIFGTLVHYRVALEHGVGIDIEDGLTLSEAIDLKVWEQYGSKPDNFWYMSRVGAEISKKIDAMEEPQPGKIRRSAHEIRWKLGEDSKEAAETLWNWLKVEQTDRVMGRSDSHDLEKALKNCPFFYDHDVANPDFRALVERVIDREYTVDDVVELAFRARTHRLLLDGKLLMAQSATADEVMLETDDFDFYANQIGDALRDILDSEYSYDPEYLYSCIFEIYDKPGGKPRFMNGSEIVYRAAELICDDRLKCTLFDLKTHFHLEDTPEQDEKWSSEEIGNDPAKVWTNDLMFKTPEGMDREHQMLYGWQYDVVKTKGVLENFFRIHINEFLRQTGEIDPEVGDRHGNAAFRFASLVSKIGISLHIADADLRKGAKLGYNDPKKPTTKKGRVYNTDYPLRQVGIPSPDEITVVRVDIPSGWAMGLLEKWQMKVREIGLQAGRVAVAADVITEGAA